MHPYRLVKLYAFFPLAIFKPQKITSVRRGGAVWIIPRPTPTERSLRAAWVYPFLLLLFFCSDFPPSNIYLLRKRKDIAMLLFFGWGGVGLQKNYLRRSLAICPLKLPASFCRFWFKNNLSGVPVDLRSNLKQVYQEVSVTRSVALTPRKLCS